MIRRFYVMPLNHGVDNIQIAELLKVYNASDAFIPGLLSSAAGLDFNSRTVIWENIFTDEEAYSGPYMVHPYHSGSLDNYLMGDSPELSTHDIYTTRYETPDEIPQIQKGIRRLILMNLPEGSDVGKMESIAGNKEFATTSIFCPDNVKWVSPKGRPWTHVWEQGFTDEETIDAYLKTGEGIGTSSIEGLKRLGVQADALKIFIYPFEIKPNQNPDRPSEENFPTFYTLTARTALEDVDAYVEILKSHYDPYVVDAGGTLVHRWRTVENGYLEAEVQSTWQLLSIAAYSDVRMKTGSDPRWATYVRQAAPLLRGGSRRFYRAV